MSVKRDKIVNFCREYLKVSDFEDYCFNGLQIEGKQDVKKIVTGVSFSQKLIKEAIKRKADMIIVHHGVFVREIGSPLELKGVMKNRIKMVLQNDINLCGFHLPLDAHLVIGNNASLCKLLGVKNIKPLYVGCQGELEKKMDFKKFAELVKKKLNTNVYTINAGGNFVKKIGIISGGASDYFEIAKDAGLDTYMCGEIKEGAVRKIEEAEINFISAGHYNTEKLGIKNLGELLSKKFNIQVEFVDIPCDI